jgi:hypothetical protein
MAAQIVASRVVDKQAGTAVRGELLVHEHGLQSAECVLYLYV